MKISILVTLFAFLFAFYGYAPVSASAQDASGLVLTVNSSGDAPDADPGNRVCADAGGQCTLRAAVEEANANSTRDAIIFGLPQPAVIDLTLGELLITQNLDIVGPGARRLTVRRAAGASNFRIFHLPQAETYVNIRGLTISNGNALYGGGIFVEAGGVLGLYDSAVTGNTAQVGGGINSWGRVTVFRCLINSNNATSFGGGVANMGTTPDMTISNSTFTGNIASASGAIHNVGMMLLVNDTISENTGTSAVNGIFNTGQGVIRVLNTIIGRNSAIGNSIMGTFISGGNNIVTKANGSSGFTDGVNGDQVSNNHIIDPMLGPLADNGGQTDTMLPLTGSPAIFNGNTCVRTGQCPSLPGIPIPGGRLDQRKFRRNPSAPKIDIGALDTGAFAGTAVGSFILSGVGGGGPVSRFVGAPVDLIDPTTLERRHSRVRLNGAISFTNLPIDVFVIEVRSKRPGLTTPLVFGRDF